MLTHCSVKMGSEGGERAAHALQDEIRQELKKLYPTANTNNWKIMVVIIAAMDSLSYAYQNHLAYHEEFAGVYWPTTLRQFAIGFNRGAHHTFNFIDIGGGRGLKELTDTKLRETFSMSMATSTSPEDSCSFSVAYHCITNTPLNQVFPHCKHVFFAGCHDSGYVSFLNPYKHERSHAEKVTLIETHNTNPHYRSLGFGMTSFPGIFRSEDFPQAPLRMPTTINTSSAPPGLNGRTTPPSVQPARTSSISELPRLTSPFAAASSSATPSTRAMTPSTTSQASSNWVTVSKSGVAANGKTTVIDIAPAKKKAKPFIAVNREGERVDIQLPKTNKLAEQTFHKKVQEQGQNFCNTCNIYGPDTCDQTDQRFLHGRADLSPDEFNVLRMKVRGLPCQFGSGCPDSSCAAGHHCRHGRNCTMTTCRFADTHHMDIVSRGIPTES